MLRPGAARDFNSRSCEGATRVSSDGNRIGAHFNSRSCEGATKAEEETPQPKPISTHAPVKERLPTVTETAHGRHFNSRSCEGATDGSQKTYYYNPFQLTLL